MTVDAVVAELGTARDLGARVAIVDHLHRIALDGRNVESETRGMMRRLKDAAERLDMILLCGAQLNRGERDPLKRYLPPLETDLRNGGSIEEESDVVFGLYLPLRPDVTRAQIAAARAREGGTSINALRWDGMTGVRILKHRADGSAVERDVFLAYEHGRLMDRYGA
jgi:replicative DNA helicase